MANINLGGATLTVVAVGFNITPSGSQTFDGYTSQNGDKVLIINEVTPASSAIFIVNNSGAWEQKSLFNDLAIGTKIIPTSSNNKGKIYTITLKDSNFILENISPSPYLLQSELTVIYDKNIVTSIILNWVNYLDTQDEIKIYRETSTFLISDIPNLTPLATLASNITTYTDTTVTTPTEYFYRVAFFQNTQLISASEIVQTTVNQTIGSIYLPQYLTLLPTPAPVVFDYHILGFHNVVLADNTGLVNPALLAGEPRVQNTGGVFDSGGVGNPYPEYFFTTSRTNYIKWSEEFNNWVNSGIILNQIGNNNNPYSYYLIPNTLNIEHKLTTLPISIPSATDAILRFSCYGGVAGYYNNLIVDVTNLFVTGVNPTDLPAFINIDLVNKTSNAPIDLVHIVFNDTTAGQPARINVWIKGVTITSPTTIDFYINSQTAYAGDGTTKIMLWLVDLFKTSEYGIHFQTTDTITTHTDGIRYGNKLYILRNSGYYNGSNQIWCGSLYDVSEDLAVPQKKVGNNDGVMQSGTNGRITGYDIRNSFGNETLYNLDNNILFNKYTIQDAINELANLMVAPESDYLVISEDGDDTYGNGSLLKPVASLQKAITLATPPDVPKIIKFRTGTYNIPLTAPLNSAQSGISITTLTGLQDVILNLDVSIENITSTDIKDAIGIYNLIFIAGKGIYYDNVSVIKEYNNICGQHYITAPTPFTLTNLNYQVDKLTVFDSNGFVYFSDGQAYDITNLNANFTNCFLPKDVVTINDQCTFVNCKTIFDNFSQTPCVIYIDNKVGHTQQFDIIYKDCSNFGNNISDEALIFDAPNSFIRLWGDCDFANANRDGYLKINIDECAGYEIAPTVARDPTQDNINGVRLIYNGQARDVGFINQTLGTDNVADSLDYLYTDKLSSSFETNPAVLQGAFITPSVGTAFTVARADHVHPLSASPVFTAGDLVRTGQVVSLASDNKIYPLLQTPSTNSNMIQGLGNSFKSIDNGSPANYISKGVAPLTQGFVLTYVSSTTTKPQLIISDGYLTRAIFPTDRTEYNSNLVNVNNLYTLTNPSVGDVIYNAVAIDDGTKYYIVLAYGTQNTALYSILLLEYDTNSNILGEQLLTTVVPATTVYSVDLVLSSSGASGATHTIVTSNARTGAATNIQVIAHTITLVALGTSTISSGVLTLITTTNASTDSTAVQGRSLVSCQTATNRVLVQFARINGFIDALNISVTGTTVALLGSLQVASLTSPNYVGAMCKTTTDNLTVWVYTGANIAINDGITSTLSTVYIACVNNSTNTPTLVFGGSSTPVPMPDYLTTVRLNLLSCSICKLQNIDPSYDTFVVIFSDQSTENTTANLFYAVFKLNLTPSVSFGGWLYYNKLIANNAKSSGVSGNGFKNNRAMALIPTNITSFGYRLMISYLTNNDISYRLLTFNTYLNYSRAIGIAQADAVANATTSVTLFNNLLNTSSLPAGTKYYLNNLGDLTNTKTEVPIGTVIATNIISVQQPKIVDDLIQPTVIINPALGTGSFVLVDGNQYAGKISFRTGGAVTANASLFTLTFNNPFTKQPIITFTPTKQNSIGIQFFITNQNGLEQYQISCESGTSLAINTWYVFTYNITV